MVSVGASGPVTFAFAALELSRSKEIDLRRVVCQPQHEFDSGMYSQPPVDASKVELDCLRVMKSVAATSRLVALGDEPRDLRFLRRPRIGEEIPGSARCHPNGACADGDATEGTADGDRPRERVRLGVDSRDGSVEAVRDPD